MSEPFLHTYATGFGLILGLGLFYAVLRRSWPLGVATAFFGSPAPFFGIALARYEASLPPGANIRLDLPLFWAILAIGAAMSTLLAAYVVVDLLAFSMTRLPRREQGAG